MSGAVLRLQPPDKPITSRPRLEGPLNGIALIWVAVVYRLLAQLKDDPPPSPFVNRVTREIDDTGGVKPAQRRVLSSPKALKDVHLGGVVHMWKGNASTGVFVKQ